MNRYLIDDSQQEVNLPATVKKAIVNVFSQAIALLETVHTEESLEAVNKALSLLKDELMSNMNDPFSRYVKSDYFFELGAAFFDKKVDILTQRERLMQATVAASNSAQGGEASVNFEDFLNLQTRGSWDKNQTARHPATVVEDLLNQLQDLLTNTVYLWDSVFNMQYEQLQQTGLCNWLKFKEFTTELSAIDLDVLKSKQSSDQIVSFFINVHNVMLLHAAIEYQGIPSCAVGWIQFARKVKYNIGGLSLSLDQISHGILRSNQRHVIFGKRFAHYDTARMSLIPTQIPSKVVFALITMQEHSPRLRIYNAQQLQSQLDDNTSEYLKEYLVVSNNGELVQVPQAVKSLALEVLSRKGQFAFEFVAFIKAASSEHFAQVKDNAKVHVFGSFLSEAKTSYGAVLPAQSIEQIRSLQLQIIKNKGLGNTPQAAALASPSCSSSSSSDHSDHEQQQKDAVTIKNKKAKCSKKQKLQHLLKKAHTFAKKLFGIYA